jgi:8-oxo-dGTP pyrophosphatase MutT (NUDIX family)
MNLTDRTDEYRNRDLHGENAWPTGGSRRYGGVVFNGDGAVLLREPLNHFDGYHWTFPKGKPEYGELPIETALRETVEETGLSPIVIGHVPGRFSGTSTGASSYFYLMFDESELVPQARHDETASVRWVQAYEAIALIKESTNLGGRQRDLEILETACKAFAELNDPSV